jgi:hypothetical protein
MPGQLQIRSATALFDQLTPFMKTSWGVLKPKMFGDAISIAINRE